jgi:site-specific DNA-methyltransferase (adenine-specific)
MTDLFNNSPNDQKKADELINAGHLDIVNRSPLSLVFNEDCVSGMKRFSDGHFDLAIVDPPYGIGAGSKSFINRNTANARAEKFYKDNDWDKNRPAPEYWKELFRVSKNWIVWGGNYFTQYLPPARCFIVWDKKTGENSYADCELALTNIDSNARIITKFWLGAHAQDDDGRIHPTQKPIMVYDFICQNYTQPGFKILDTHLGSGSSRIACEKAGLDFVGFELDTDYFLAQEKRFKDHLVQGRLFNADFC